MDVSSWATCKCHSGKLWKSWNLIRSPTVQGSLIPRSLSSNCTNSVASYVLTLARSSFFSASSSPWPFRCLFDISWIRLRIKVLGTRELKGKKMASGRRHSNGKSPEDVLYSQGLKELLVIPSSHFIINVRATFIASFSSGTDIAGSYLGQKSCDPFWELKPRETWLCELRVICWGQWK